jgi:uncharacterized delta-60 repeat protein
MGQVRIGARRAALTLAAIALLSASVVALEPAGAAVHYEGQLDTTFNGQGWISTMIGAGASAASGVALEPNGSIVAAGTSVVASGLTAVAVVRCLANGKLDPSFGHHGIVVTPVGLHNSSANAVAIQPNGKIVVVGSTNDFDLMMVLRYNLNGTLDSTFGSGGLAEYAIGATVNIGTAVAIQPNGRILLGGSFFNGLNDDMAVVRFNSNGSLDTSFNGTGFQTTTAELGSNEDTATSMALQPNGKILLAGLTKYANYDTTVVRFDVNGSFDTTFGVGGIRDDDFGGGNDGAFAIAAVSNDHFYVAGYEYSGSKQELHVASYGGNGAVVFDAAPYGTDLSLGDGLVVQRNGDLVMAEEGALAPVRLSPALAQDAEFGPSLDGIGQLPPSRGIRAVAIQRDGRIVGVGTSSSQGFLVARWLGDTRPPVNAQVLGLSRFSLAPKLGIKWSAMDAGTGVKSFDVQVRSAMFGSAALGPWSALTTKTAKTTAAIKAVPGATYCARVRASDVAGNVGGFSPPSCSSIALDERAMKATGTWTKVSGSLYYLGTAMSSSVSGSALKTSAHFRHLAVVVTTCPTCGRIKVFLGAKLLGTMSLQTTATIHRQVIQVYASSSTISGVVRLVQNSAKKLVTIEGVAFDIA